MMKQNTFCVIMAGGVGSRFWPLSRNKTPKQFLDILGAGKTLIQQTFDRFLPICNIENFVVVTSEEYVEQVLNQLPMLTEEQILTEPFRRNTAPCIALANAWIKLKNPNANIVVTPADHLILNEEAFVENIERGLNFVRTKDVLLTLGITPHKPETGYGYIQKTDLNDTVYEDISQVKTFTEKPNYELAKVFFESGEFFWNSGIFIWRLKTIEDAFGTHLPEVDKLFNKLTSLSHFLNKDQTLIEIYADCKNISIDYGIMEKANNVYVQTVKFGWSDLGTWSSLYEYSAQDKNNNAIVSGKALLYETNNSVVNIPSNKTAIIQGLENYIIVDSKDALLICPKDNEQQIRQFTTDIKTEFGDDTL